MQEDQGKRRKVEKDFVELYRAEILQRLDDGMEVEEAIMDIAVAALKPAVEALAKKRDKKSGEFSLRDIECMITNAARELERAALRRRRA